MLMRLQQQVGMATTTDASGTAPTESNFLVGGGEMAAVIRSFDWAKTPLGPIDQWPNALKTAIGSMLMSPVPIVTLWGEDGIMLYNDAYSVFAGGRHPQLLGSKVREGWPEVADFNDNVMKTCLGGGTLSYKDWELTLHRHGQPEQVWMNLDYSPIMDGHGKPAGSWPSSSRQPSAFGLSAISARARNGFALLPRPPPSAPGIST